MAIIDAVVNYRRWLKRRNCSPHTLRTYMNTLRHFVLWLALRAHRLSFDARYTAPVEAVGLYWHFVDLVWVFWKSYMVDDADVVVYKVGDS